MQTTADRFSWWFFVNRGGKYLFIDEIHKYKDWAKELKLIYDYHPELNVVFTGSSVLDIKKGASDLSRRAVMYNMQGLSFREYLQLFHQISHKSYSLEEIFDEKDYQFAFVPVAEELSELLDELGLQNHLNSDSYIIAPDVLNNRKYLEDFASKSFTFFFKRLKRNYSRQLKHFRKTYITQEDSFINRRISMQHSNYQTTSKHYIDRKEIAKDMVKQGFRVFPK